MLISILIFHILVALAGLFYSVYVFFYPSKRRINTVYGLLGLIVISGSYLIYLKPAHMTQTCIEGLVYIGVILGATVLAKNKLKTIQS